MQKITEELISWYQENKRDLPWRHTKNPYYIWISEIMLQQTRVETVKEYFIRFIKKLPTLTDLAEIDEDELLKLWEGLGYYSRVRNMQKTAKRLIENGYDNLPNTKDELLNLPGIGEYTAGAILSIAYDIPTIAIDGNVYRVIGRVYEINASLNKPATYKIYANILEKLLPKENASNFTQSFMDLGSLICTPKNPKCEICPLNKKCGAYKKNIQENYPVKEKKKVQKIEERVVYLYKCKNKYAIEKRKETGLLASLYEFPNTLESSSLIDIENDLLEKKIPYQSILEIGESKHVFSHKIWYMKGYLIELKKPLKDYLWVTKEELQNKYSIPSAFSYFYDYIINRETKRRQD